MSRVLTNKVETIGSTNEGYWQWKQITYLYWDVSVSNTSPTVVVEIYYGNSDTTKHTIISIYDVRVTVDGVHMTNEDNFDLNLTLEPGEWSLMDTFEFPLTYNVGDDVTIVTKHSGYFAGTQIESKTTNIPLTPPTWSYTITDEDKAALKSNTAAIRCKLIVKPTDTLPEIILTDNDSIKDWVYTDDRYVPQQGFIGQFVARTLEGNLQNISEDFNIENREVELQMGVVKLGSRFTYVTTQDGVRLLAEDGSYIIFSELPEDATNWYSFGNFIVTNPEDDEVKDNTKFEAMDYTKLFNQNFDADFSNDNFPESFNTKLAYNSNGVPTGSVTLLWLAKYTCAQVDVEFPQEYFTNSDFIMDRNPFQANETCRDVMKEIAKLAFSWVRIDWDNACYIDFGEGVTTYGNDEQDIIDNNQYFTLETKKQVYGPVNKIYIGPSNIEGELVVVAEDPTSIAENGEHPLYIYDSSITYTPALREKIANNGSASKLLGLSYSQLNTETIGHPWFKGNELVTVVDMENKNHSTYAFNRSIKYSGHIRTTLDSMGETEVEATLAYENDIKKDLINAKILVDKATGDITLWSERTKNVEDNMGNYYTKTDTDNLILNATEGLTNIYTSAGGNNKFRNTALYFKEGNGFEYWDGPVAVITEMDSAHQTAILLQNGSVKQTVTGLPNYTTESGSGYTISFKYKQLNPVATASVYLNNTKYDLGTEAGFEQTISVTTNQIEIQFDCDTNNGYEIYDLMCNVGASALVWTQHPDEVMTDTVNISKGIKITSTSKNAIFKADADGIRIENTLDKTTTEFTDSGMITNDAEIKGQAKVSGALHTKVGNQTWISGL